MTEKVECARCDKVVCGSEHSQEGPSNCPTRTKSEVINRALQEYDKPEIM